MMGLCAALKTAGLVLCLVFLSSCAGFNQYSLEQAEEVATSFEHVRKLPPKSSSDILRRIEAARAGQAAKEKEVLDLVTGEPPAQLRKSKNKGKLINYYRKRSAAALLAGRLEQALADIKLALSLASPDDTRVQRSCLPVYCSIQYRLGEYADAVRTMEEMVLKNTSWNNAIYLAYFAAGVGDAASARKYAQPIIEKIDNCQKGCPPSHLKYWGKYTIARAEGDWRQAAVFAEKAVRLIQQDKKYKNWTIQLGVEFLYNDMVQSLVRTGQLVRAENEARDHFSRLLDRFGPHNWPVLEALESLAQVRLAREQAGDAELLFRKEIELLEEIETPEDSLVMARAHYFLGKSLAAQGTMRAAAAEFRHVRDSLVRNSFLYGKIFAVDADVPAVMIATGAAREALALLDAAQAHQESVSGKDGPQAQLLRALRAAALLGIGRPGEAAGLLGEAMPLILGRWADLDDSHSIQLGVVADALVELARTGDAGSLPTYAFQLSCALKKGSVQRFINANAARSLISDPGAQQLARMEQDAQFRISSLQDQLSDSLLATKREKDKKVISQLKDSIRDLVSARASILAELERIAPEYTALTRPTLAAPVDIARSLRPGEAMLAFFATDAGVCAWLISPSGEVALHGSGLTREELGRLVARVRAGLEPDQSARGGIAAFDLEAAHALYRELVEPFEGRLSNVENLVVVKDGALEQIPFAILPTAAVRLEPTRELWGEYRKVPWLVRRFALSTVPTPESLAVVRSQPRNTGAVRRFVGFGDPVFAAREQAPAASDQRRTAAVAFRKTADTSGVASANLSFLPRLPETADELQTIAGYFGDGTGNRIFLREEATERAVTTFDFRDFSVVSFATHGLKAGMLDGLDQPALALTAPSEASAGEDGLLTAEEILGLDLRADLVMLSACDTAAPEGGSSEMLSGLARSFFYAGASSLLVSSWPVDSVSTVQLTSGMMQGYIRESKGKAEALRASMLALIDGPGYVDASGHADFSYAHPIFFGPFMLVGDGR